MIKPENTPHPFGGFVYPYAAGECLDYSFSGVPTKSEIEEAHVTLEIALRADEYIAALNYASQMVSVLSKQRAFRRSLWQRICDWFRYQLGL